MDRRQGAVVSSDGPTTISAKDLLARSSPVLDTAISASSKGKALKLLWKSAPEPIRRQVLQTAQFSIPKEAALTDVFLSREKRNAVAKAEGHFTGKGVIDWEDFLSAANRKSFVKALESDPRADPKLRRHADQMNRLQTGSPVATVSGEGGRKYQIIRKRGGGLACTCPDWRYKRCVGSSDEQACKHIKKYLESK